MSEVQGEMSAPVEKESGAVKKMAERVGKFLSETYTFKGATAKEMRAFDNIASSFTPSQQEEMRAYFSAKAEKNAKWKVIRNWVATGAGVALGTTMLLRPDLVTGALVTAGKVVGTWWKDAGVALAGVKTGMANFGTGVKEWIFDTGSVRQIVIPKSQITAEASKQWAIAGKNLQDFSDALAKPFVDTKKGLEPLWASMRKGLQIPLPEVVVN